MNAIADTEAIEHIEYELFRFMLRWSLLIIGLIMATESEKLIKKHPELTLSTDKKVLSHVQRTDDDWILNTLMIEGCDTPFKYKRKKKYKSLKGARVNLSYYTETKLLAGIEFEIMKVVKVNRA